MNGMDTYPESKAKNLFARPEYWLLFIAYLAVLGMTIGHHELWGDELHSWNIAKASDSYTRLIANIRYEGHPPLWYSLMWVLSKFTHNLVFLQCLQFALAASFIFVLIFYAPFSLLTKALLPFGYYLLYEYGVLSRNYAAGILLCFCICTILQDKGRKRYVLYYLLLFLMANTHLLAVLLAASLHLYFLLRLKEEGKKGAVWGHLLLGAMVLAPALYCIFPPSDSEMNMDFWLSKWNPRQLTDIAEAPLKSFMPVQAWWEYHSWNTQVILDSSTPGIIKKPVAYILSGLFLLLAFVLLRQNRKCLALFTANLVLTCLIAAIFPLTSSRYVGFLFLSLVVSSWLYYADAPMNVRQRTIFQLLLVLQLCGSMVAVPKDLRLAFSNSFKVKDMMGKVPGGERVVTDYWCLNNLAAYLDRPFYCIELNRELSFILWDSKLAAVMDSRRPYTNGVHQLFTSSGLKSVYLLSTNAPEKLHEMEPALFESYHVEAIEATTGAIEKYSNLYLYHIAVR
jgi:hypothetical protein